ncbi:hypothetical protein PLESTB_001528200 [Pleodorina starrii]|uniref:SET domain-containing protein n=1 Tax=Pleodorina starrii TaxID=330485 RepID=A0A9W6BXN3_9CHLO|nr:hypothetical protein PLESTM_001165400 [Pleodorina starrii]GLC59737.1 hypothetical protein PLESTB_001528200 [Pleodorina starrii]GLC75341.1 hypothetical protein PLESTF_001625700 [Pleodorina starrii]
MRNTASATARAPFPSAKPRNVVLLCNYDVQRRIGVRTAKSIGQALLEATAETRDAVVPLPLPDVDAALRAWIQLHGGSVWNGLRVTDNAPCGCRGVIATAPLPAEAARTAPLIVVPERLYMTSDDARQLLQPLEAKRFSLSFWREDLPGAVQLAVLLAVERQRGDDSFWAPYVRSLPASPPCAWALTDAELSRALAALGPGTAGWERAVAAARRSVYQRAEQTVQRYGRHLPGELSADDVVWAMGQVLSRSFGREPDVALAPYIDLCNHRHGAPRPGGFVDEQDGVSYAFVESSSFGEPRALLAGDEVYVSYIAAGGDPLSTFLNLGFVPPELQPLLLLPGAERRRG